MRYLTWFLTAALLLSWPELRTVLLDTAVYALTTPWTLILMLSLLAARRIALLVQEATRSGRRFV